MFRAYPSSKGLERKVIVVFASLFYLNKNPEQRRDVCPNPIYVALTRSKRLLIVIGTTLY
jgi:hypothetical protein